MSIISIFNRVKDGIIEDVKNKTFRIDHYLVHSIFP